MLLRRSFVEMGDACTACPFSFEEKQLKRVREIPLPKKLEV